MTICTYHNAKLLINTIFIIPAVLICIISFPFCYILNLFHPKKRLVTWYEIHDLDWCPTIFCHCIQDMLTNYHFCLHYIFPRPANDINDPTNILSTVVKNCNVTKIIALCSGGGGNEVFNFLRLKEKVNHLDSIILTDLKPNVNRWKTLINDFNDQGKHIKYSTTPVDATNVPKKLGGLRWLSCCFHHFEEDLCIRIFQSAVDDNQPIVIVDGKPNVYTIVVTVVMMFFVHLALVCLEFWRIDRLLCFPFVEIMNLHDTTVSSLRYYNISQLRTMISKVKNSSNYNWIFNERKPFGHILIGSPKLPHSKLGGADANTILSEN